MHFNDSEVANLVLVADGAVDELVSEVADSRYVEELVVVGERDPKATVVCVFVIYLALGEFSPLGSTVRPIALPFFLSPRIANLQYAFSLSIIKFDYLAPLDNLQLL